MNNRFRIETCKTDYLKLIFRSCAVIVTDASERVQCESYAEKGQKLLKTAFIGIFTTILRYIFMPFQYLL